MRCLIRRAAVVAGVAVENGIGHSVDSSRLGRTLIQPRPPIRQPDGVA